MRLNFSRIAYGDGRLQTGQNLRDLTALISFKLDLPIIANTVTGNGTSAIRAFCTNTGLSEGFDVREIGVFADDPDEGEILYCVGNAGDYTDYIPAGNGSDLIETIVEVITVIKQATNVTATINTSLAFLSAAEFDTHVSSQNPHPDFIKKLAATSNPSHIWGQVNSDGQLHPVSIEDTRTALLGGQASSIPALSGRIGQAERNIANIALALEAQQIYPDYNALLAEDFVTPDKIDTFSCAVTSIVAGDDSIDVATLTGLMIGGTYTVSDGVRQEGVQVKSIVKNGTTLRVILTAPVTNTYLTDSTTLYRTTAQILTGKVEGAGEKATSLWQPTTTWQGVNANVRVTAALVTTQGNSGAFVIAGDIAFNTDGEVTLV